jgi:hypothetical protein
MFGPGIMPERGRHLWINRCRGRPEHRRSVEDVCPRLARAIRAHRTGFALQPPPGHRNRRAHRSGGYRDACQECHSALHVSPSPGKTQAEDPWLPHLDGACCLVSARPCSRPVRERGLRRRAPMHHRRGRAGPRSLRRCRPMPRMPTWPGSAPAARPLRPAPMPCRASNRPSASAPTSCWLLFRSRCRVEARQRGGPASADATTAIPGVGRRRSDGRAGACQRSDTARMIVTEVGVRARPGYGRGVPSEMPVCRHGNSVASALPAWLRAAGETRAPRRGQPARPHLRRPRRPASVMRPRQTISGEFRERLRRWS